MLFLILGGYIFAGVVINIVASLSPNLRDKAAPDYESQRNAGDAEDMIFFRNLCITVVILIVIGLCMIKI